MSVVIKMDAGDLTEQDHLTGIELVADLVKTDGGVHAWKPVPGDELPDDETLVWIGVDADCETIVQGYRDAGHWLLNRNDTEITEVCWWRHQDGPEDTQRLGAALSYIGILLGMVVSKDACRTNPFNWCEVHQAAHVCPHAAITMILGIAYGGAAEGLNVLTTEGGAK